jgi:hypothetical protein
VSDRTALIAKFAAVLVLLSISACARPIGDFGRAEPTPTIIAQTHEIGSPTSRFNWTDEEQEMRDRIWRYLVSPHGYDWLGDSATELARLGYAHAHFRPSARQGYYRWLSGSSFASSRVRYARLSDDVEADLGTLPAAFASVCAVQQVDHRRAVAANGLPQSDPGIRAAAEARQAENRATIRWFSDTLEARYDAYSYALDNLLIETPHDLAIAADAKLSELQSAVEAADSGEFCSGLERSFSVSQQATPGSRYVPRGDPGGS